VLKRWQHLQGTFMGHVLDLAPEPVVQKHDQHDHRDFCRCLYRGYAMVRYHCASRKLGEYFIVHSVTSYTAGRSFGWVNAISGSGSESVIR
jgi:hypothetical protein